MHTKQEYTGVINKVHLYIYPYYSIHNFNTYMRINIVLCTYASMHMYMCVYVSVCVLCACIYMYNMSKSLTLHI